MIINLLEDILKYVSACLSIIVFLLTATCFVINKIKQKNKRTNAEAKADELGEELRKSEDAYKLVNEIIPLAIKKAEEMPLIDGPTKKLLAMSEILLNCNADGICFEKYKDFISEQIEALIQFSKTINKRKE